MHCGVPHEPFAQTRHSAGRARSLGQPLLGRLPVPLLPAARCAGFPAPPADRPPLAVPLPAAGATLPAVPLPAVAAALPAVPLGSPAAPASERVAPELSELGCVRAQPYSTKHKTPRLVRRVVRMQTLLVLRSARGLCRFVPRTARSAKRCTEHTAELRRCERQVPTQQTPA